MSVTEQPPRSLRDGLTEGLHDLAAAVAVFVPLAVVAAIVWWQVTPLSEVVLETKGEDPKYVGIADLEGVVSTDGWFFVVTAVAGLLSGVVFAWWRRRDPVLTVLVVAAGGLLAAYLTTELGRILGPSDPADAPLLEPVQLQLVYLAKGLVAVWPIAALVGALGVILGTERYEAGRVRQHVGPDS